MCTESCPSNDQNPYDAPAPEVPADQAAACRTCGELLHAEAVANAQRDHSRATDCRVLLRRHRATDACADRGSK
ncbi:hypothetical protein [Streptomyces sp. 8L]|uniref:hypothetical protein n=1 Tax=Streptomyces sp. 8L TaxID=2877242 RepID=UPI001CD3152D|nr:hypothetical protein [Streptomyces sp. 8L]MCA1218252.1 hypothetical protein [Streptomyces sp. 8L]